MAKTLNAILNSPELARLWSSYIESGRGIEFRNRLVVLYMPLAKAIAMRVLVHLPKAPNLQLDDLISVGNIGLLKAIERCDPSRKTRPHTFLSIRIKAAMLDELRIVDGMKRRTRLFQKQLKAARDELTKEIGGSPTPEEMAARLKISPRLLQFRDALVAAGSVKPLPRNADGEVFIHNAQNREPDPLQAATDNDFRDSMMSVLLMRERDAISGRHYEELPWETITARWNKPEAAGHFQHRQALARIRKTFSKDTLAISAA